MVSKLSLKRISLQGTGNAKGKSLPTRNGSPPNDADVRVAGMKDGCTRLDYEPEHAVDLNTGVVLALYWHGKFIMRTKATRKTLNKTLGSARGNLSTRDDTGPVLVIGATPQEDPRTLDSMLRSFSREMQDLSSLESFQRILHLEGDRLCQTGEFSEKVFQVLISAVSGTEIDYSGFHKSLCLRSG